MENLQLSPGSLFANRFKIDSPYRIGGMGTVYRALDEHSGQTVALKVLHPVLRGPAEKERFLREAQFLSELHHPGIVSYLAHGQTPSGQSFLAMEWLSGIDLGDVLVGGAIAETDCLTIARQLLDALSFCHARGIVHRDVKPSNIFLVDGDIGKVKLLDFGIARSVVNLHPITRSGVLIGTPAYMAPEQVRETQTLTPASDLFSIGCVLYECLCGQPPFVAEHVATVLVRILFDEPIPIEDRRPGISPFAAALVRQLLEKQPDQRPQSAISLRRILDDAGELETGAATSLPVIQPEKAGRFASQEQSLCSVVIAGTTADLHGPLGTQPGSHVVLPAKNKRSLLQELEGLGVSAEFLATGTLVVTVSPMISAQDQATVAARTALIIKERWPEATVSMATGRGTLHGRSVVGEVIDLAAKRWKMCIQELETANTSGVLVDELSAKLLDGRFCQIQTRSGTLLIPSEALTDESRLLLGKPTPCVGRDPELGMLDALLAACVDNSEARVILFTAPPGVGKSRLRHEFLRTVDKRRMAVSVLLGRGDLMAAGVPYGILRNAILRLCGISGSEPLSVQRQMLARRIATNIVETEQRRIVAFISELCQLPWPDEDLPLLHSARKDPKLMRDCRRRAFLDFLAAECTFAPVLLVLDDLHWGDGQTVSLLDETLRTLASLPFLLLAFARPDVHESFPKLWVSHKVQEIPLKGLSRRACQRLIVQVLGSNVEKELVDSAIAKSAGNALFLEELIRSLAEGRTDLHSETVLAMLQARLGRLDSNLNRVLRAAAIFGANFWAEGVAWILGLSSRQTEVMGWLEELIQQELILSIGDGRLPGQREFRFHHALVRDAAYSLLTADDLRIGHLRAAEFLASAGERDASLFAEHYEKGGDHLRAAQAFAHAAERVLEDAGMEAALHFVDRALRLAPTGETLGRLRSIECAGLFWMFEFDRSFPLAMEAMALLRAGCGAFCRALSLACQVAIHGSVAAQQKLPDLLPLLLTIEPDSDGLAHLIEGLGDLAATLCCVSPYPMLQVLLSRQETLLARIISEDPLMERWLYFARSLIIHHHQPTPWFTLQESLRAIELSQRAGDERTRLKAEVLGKEMVMSELGDPKLPDRLLATLRGPRMGDDNLVRVMGFILVGLFLSQCDDDESQNEALRCADDIRSLGAEMTLSAGFGHLITAQVALKRNRPDVAESEARVGLPRLTYVPLWMPLAQRLLIQALLAQSRFAEAVAVADQGLVLLTQFHSLGCLEVELRLAIAEALYASGSKDRGTTELGATLHQIQLRVDDILDPTWRQSYLTRNPHCVRAQNLARQWNVSIPERTNCE